ncbi:methyltransferase domain-containing protein [Mucilaginibacter paludis]|uniref:Methyltransferase type 12 n=1 Tax=Mucilaginibacter paludis DSM 18603 TaxID=714943 RepID=H1YED3_9SPHI|nr:class I SAM-dependent methyltransferase [Mucilaginibacter paludis]EHQ27167.1 methyltransferase type 12 [Mucilaginibacter paludis DSM 18603]
MNSLIDSASIFRYHRDMIVLHGSQDSKALGWLDKKSQSVRFEALSTVADLRGCSMLDAGCGYGDLFGYLDQNFTDISYWGMEQIPELLEEAELRYGHNPRVTFLPGNFMYSKLPICGYTIACGSLSYHSADPDFVFKAIARLYENCKLGLGFNLLRSIPVNELIVAYNPQVILSYCRTLSAKCIMLDDYVEDDFTVFMYH